MPIKERQMGRPKNGLLYQGGLRIRVVSEPGSTVIHLLSIIMFIIVCHVSPVIYNIILSFFENYICCTDLGMRSHYTAVFHTPSRGSLYYDTSCHHAAGWGCYTLSCAPHDLRHMTCYKVICASTHSTLQG